MPIDYYPYQPPGIWPPGPAFPALPNDGDLFYETDTDKLWAYDLSITAWVQQIASGAWDVYTTGIDASVTDPGISSQGAKWTRLGRTIHGYGRMTLSTGGSGVYEFNLPVACNPSTNAIIGSGWLYDGSLNLMHAATLISPNTAIIRAGIYDTQPGTAGGYGVTHLIPWTWATGDIISFAFTYEAAAST